MRPVARQNAVRAATSIWAALVLGPLPAEAQWMFARFPLNPRDTRECLDVFRARHEQIAEMHRAADRTYDQGSYRWVDEYKRLSGQRDENSREHQVCMDLARRNEAEVSRRVAAEETAKRRASEEKQRDEVQSARNRRTERDAAARVDNDRFRAEMSPEQRRAFDTAEARRRADGQGTQARAAEEARSIVARDRLNAPVSPPSGPNSLAENLLGDVQTIGRQTDALRGFAEFAERLRTTTNGYSLSGLMPTTDVLLGRGFDVMTDRAFRAPDAGALGTVPTNSVAGYFAREALDMARSNAGATTALAGHAMDSIRKFGNEPAPLASASDALSSAYTRTTNLGSVRSEARDPMRDALSAAGDRGLGRPGEARPAPAVSNSVDAAAARRALYETVEKVFAPPSPVIPPRVQPAGAGMTRPSRPALRPQEDRNARGTESTRGLKENDKGSNRSAATSIPAFGCLRYELSLEASVRRESARVNLRTEHTKSSYIIKRADAIWYCDRGATHRSQ